MNNRTFIEDPKLVSEILNQLDLTGKTTGYKLELLINQFDGQHWKKYEFEVAGNDAYGLRKHPYPNTAEIIEIALNSEFMDEVDGACALLHHLEWTERLEFREKLLDKIERNQKGMDLNRFNIIFDRTGLSDNSNKRDVRGKTVEEVEADYQYFTELTNRAIKLKGKITATNNGEHP
jgi:hypothetical protein